MRDSKGRFLKGMIVHGQFSKTGVDRACLHCSKLFYVKRRDILKGWGKFCSRECMRLHPRSSEWRENLAKWQRGENSQFWKGGISKKMTIEYSRKEWQQLRKQIYERDNYVCQKCLKKCKSGEFQCHHIVPNRIGRIKKFIFWNITVNDPANLITLCKSCHKKVDNEIQINEKKGIYGITPILSFLS